MTSPFFNRVLDARAISASTCSLMIVKLTADNVVDGTAGLVVDALEYTSDVSSGTSEQYVLITRMPGQLWDDDAHSSYNYHRWYRREDGRYLQPDPIGLAGGEPG
jgi:RHS repeat-associated protein